MSHIQTPFVNFETESKFPKLASELSRLEFVIPLPHSSPGPSGWDHKFLPPCLTTPPLLSISVNLTVQGTSYKWSPTPFVFL